MKNKEFKYIEISNKIKNDILSGKYKTGDAIPSDNQLSKAYNISNNTAREAIGALVHDNLVERIRGKGTFVKEIIKKRKTVGLIVHKISASAKEGESDYDVMHKYIQAIENEARLAEIDLILSIYYNAELERECLQNAISRNVDGIISFFSCSRDNHDIFKDIEDRGIPCILMDRYHSDMSGTKIGTDCFNASQKVVDYLVLQGFKNIYYFNSDYEIWNPITPRLEGYKSGCIKNNIFSHVVYPLNAEEKSSWQEIGYDMAKHVIDTTKPPFAIFGVAPAFAVGAYRAIEELGLDKKQIAIACYDNPYIQIPNDIHSVYIIQNIIKMSKIAIANIINPGKSKQEILIEPDILIINN